MSRTAESVWDYPRPPRLEAVGMGVRVVHCGVAVAESSRALRVLETSHPPVYYVPPGDVRMELMRPSARRGSFCEWKGAATYWDLVLPGELEGAEVVVAEVAWSYPRPTTSLRGCGITWRSMRARWIAALSTGKGWRRSRGISMAGGSRPGCGGRLRVGRGRWVGELLVPGCVNVECRGDALLTGAKRFSVFTSGKTLYFGEAIGLGLHRAKYRGLSAPAFGLRSR